MLTENISRILFTFLICIAGCTSWNMGDTMGFGGGGELVLELHVRQGKELMCVQGAGGDFSHSVDNTRYDLDLDTSNSIDDEVYAPATGIAYVHTESATSGFGYHVNIDVGSGQYVVIAHLSDIFITDGAEVAAGELIGYEGCTGYCTGDHIHLGLHEGSAAENADQGVSIPAWYNVSDASLNTGVQALSSEAFICGMRSEGDPEDGHFYESELQVPMWHPDGTLVKAPDNARVYLVEDGKLKWLENEAVFWSYNYDFSDVALVSDEELDCFGDGSDLTEETFIDAVFDTEGDLWLLVGLYNGAGSGNYRIRVAGTGWEAVMASWGLDYNQDNWPETHGDSSGHLTNWPPASGTALLRDGTLVTEQNSSAVYVISGGWALPVKDWETYLMLGFFDRAILTVEDGLVASLHENLGSCTSDFWCLDQEAITTCGGGLDLGSGEHGGDPSEGDAGTDSDSDSDSEEEDEEDSYEDEGETDTEGESPTCSGEDACLVDQDGDGDDDTLLMKDDLWLSSSLSGESAYIYANGGCYDGSLTTSDLVYASAEGYYEIDFSHRTSECSVELSLISSTGTNGAGPDSSMGNWYWWQNASFCAEGHDLCELKDNGTSWEEWLITVSWSPTTGLEANGNGYTSNTQL